MRKAWRNNERVLALKKAVQCAKLLRDTSVMEFYPSAWVLVTEILDTFGDLVFQRIRDRSNDTAREAAEAAAKAAAASEKGGAEERENFGNKKAKFPLPDDFTGTDVTTEARETCRNWFFKTAQIRELVPRVYVEIALARCYRFICEGEGEEVEQELAQVFDRLASSMRGIADPLVAIHARAYLGGFAG